MPALYRRLLGEAFDRLPPTLRDFHDVETERRFRSTFRVTRSRGFVRGLVCRLGRLPPACERVDLRLRVVPDGDREHWLRDFGGHRMESVQWAAGGLLVEQLGPVRLAFRLTVEGAALHLNVARAWLLGVRCPLALAPGGSGVEVGRDDGVAVVVRGTAPLLGRVVQYEGLVVPDDSPAAGVDKPEGGA